MPALKFNLSLIQSLIFCFIVCAPFVNADEDAVLKGKEIYKKYCVECHGSKLQGNSASALIKDKWLYGRSRWRLSLNIREGIPGTAMPAWGKVISRRDIENLAEFIENSQNGGIARTPALPEIVKTENHESKTQIIIAQGLDTPWGIEFVDANTALISEKPGRLRWLRNGKLDPRIISGIPENISPYGGLMDIALDPQYKKNNWIYLAYGERLKEVANRDDELAMTKVIRGKITDYTWHSEQTVFRAPESSYLKRGNRWGGRLLFDKDGNLVFPIGDMKQEAHSQLLNRPNGKIMRVRADGSIPEDNPFVKNKKAIPAIFSLGNRNSQGLALHPLTGDIWASEHGPMGGDEINIIEAGKNYGWPVVTDGIHYNGQAYKTKLKKENLIGLRDPLRNYTPSIAICPIEFYKGDMFKDWQNSLLVGALVFEELRLLGIKGKKIISEEILLKGYGRVRDIKVAPDGSIYLLLNDPHQVVRLYR